MCLSNLSLTGIEEVSMWRDLRAAQEFYNKGRQMPPSPRWHLFPLSLKPLGSPTEESQILSQSFPRVITQMMIIFDKTLSKQTNKQINKIRTVQHVVLLIDGSFTSRLHNPVSLPLHFLYSALSSISMLSLITIRFTWRQGLNSKKVLRVQSQEAPKDICFNLHSRYFSLLASSENIRGSIAVFCHSNA